MLALSQRGQQSRKTNERSKKKMVESEQLRRGKRTRTMSVKAIEANGEEQPKAQEQEKLKAKTTKTTKTTKTAKTAKTAKTKEDCGPCLTPGCPKDTKFEKKRSNVLCSRHAQRRPLSEALQSSLDDLRERQNSTLSRKGKKQLEEKLDGCVFNEQEWEKEKAATQMFADLGVLLSKYNKLHKEDLDEYEEKYAKYKKEAESLAKVRGVKPVLLQELSSLRLKALEREEVKDVPSVPVWGRGEGVVQLASGSHLLYFPSPKVKDRTTTESEKSRKYKAYRSLKDKPWFQFLRRLVIELYCRLSVSYPFEEEAFSTPSIIFYSVGGQVVAPQVWHLDSTTAGYLQITMLLNAGPRTNVVDRTWSYDTEKNKKEVHKALRDVGWLDEENPPYNVMPSLPLTRTDKDNQKKMLKSEEGNAFDFTVLPQSIVHRGPACDKPRAVLFFSAASPFAKQYDPDDQWRGTEAFESLLEAASFEDGETYKIDNELLNFETFKTFLTSYWDQAEEQTKKFIRAEIDGGRITNELLLDLLESLVRREN